LSEWQFRASGILTTAFEIGPGNLAPEACSRGQEIIKTMDQHAYMEIEEGDDIRVAT
jgi:hypothetical protein